jgi:hypothetical protein
MTLTTNQHTGFFNSPRAPYIVLLLGIVYLAFLASAIQPDSFFSGDGGIKLMVIKQYNEGHGFKYLHLSQEPWVQDIWKQGYFPFDKPFTYATAEGQMVSFPPGFQLVNSFPYAKLGYIGLYILPLLSTVLLWCFFFYLLRYTGISPAITSLALAVLIFCSPLTVYGSIYWEHMPATFLLFTGVLFLTKKKVLPLAALLLGLLSGSAVWLRPEAMVMNALFAVVIVLFYRQRKMESFLFLAGMAISVIGFFYFNYKIYGTMLGAHSLQVIEEHSMIYKLMRGVKYNWVMNKMLVTYFCFILLLLPALYTIIRKKIRLPQTEKALLIITIGYCLLTPFISPNTGGGQWGPRYLMPVIPVSVLLLVLLWKNELISNTIPAGLLKGFLILSIIYCSYLNIYGGGISRYRYENYTRIRPALRLVKQQPENAVIINTGFTAMEMADQFDKKNFFLASDSASYLRLLPLLKEKGIHSYLYVSENDSVRVHQPNLLNDGKQELVKHGGMYYLGKYNIP